MRRLPVIAIAVDVPNMERPGAELIAWYLCPDRHAPMQELHARNPRKHRAPGSNGVGVGLAEHGGRVTVTVSSALLGDVLLSATSPCSVRAAVVGPLSVFMGRRLSAAATGGRRSMPSGATGETAGPAAGRAAAGRGSPRDSPSAELRHLCGHELLRTATAMSLQNVSSVFRL
jgi:hypothetical protein